MFKIKSKLVTACAKIRAIAPWLWVDLEQDLDPAQVRRKAERLEARLAALPPMVRECFLLRVEDLMSYDEIARRLAIPREEVVANVRRAIRKLT